MSFKSKLSRLEQIAQINPMRRVTKGVQVPFVEMAALSQNFRDIQRSDVEFRVAKSAGAHFKNGDTLLARITPCLENGKTAKVNCLDENVVGEGSTEFIVLCGIYPEDDDYVYYLCRDPEFRKYAIGRMEGTSGRQRVSWQSIAAYEYLPTLPNERRASAKILAALDDRIALLRETNVTLEAIAQALFKSWFVDFDPVRAKSEGKLPEGIDEATAALFPDEFQETASGVVPKDWVIGRLIDFAKLKGGKMLSKEHFSADGEFPVYGGAGEMGRSNLYNVEGFVITVGRVGAYCGQYFWHSGKAWLNNNASHVIPYNTNYSVWLYQWLRSVDMNLIKKGAAQPFVSNTDIENLQIILPAVSVIEEFVNVCEPLFKRMASVLTSISTLANFRDVLLPRLISGQLRIADAEAEIEKVSV